MMLEQAIDQIVVLAERDELERGLARHGDNDRLVVTELTITAQLGLRLTEGDDFHDVS